MYIEKCENNPENSSTAKVSKHIPSGFLMSIISLFGSIENKYDTYRVKDCMKKFCGYWREHTMNIIDLKNEVLTKEQQESFKKTKIYYICREEFEKKYVKDKKFCKVRDHYH